MQIIETDWQLLASDQLIEQVTLGVFATDRAGVVRAWNSWMAIQSKLPAEAVVGRSLFELFPDLDERGIAATYRGVIETGVVVVRSQRFHHYLLPLASPYTDNAITSMQQCAVIAPLFDAGQIVGTITMIEDVTERVANELALRRREERYRFLIENASDIIAILSADGTIRYLSPSVERVLGYPPDELIEQPAFAYLHPDDTPELIRALATLPSPPGYRTAELRVRHKDGSWSTLEGIGKQIQRGAGAVEIMVNARDITERKRAEAALLSQARQQAIVAALGQLALTGGDLDALMEEVVACVARILDVPYCAILERLPDQRAFVVRADIGWRNGLAGVATIDAESETLAGYTLRVGMPVIVDDLRAERRFRRSALLHEHSVASGMSVPIFGQRQPFGILGAYTTSRRSFAEEDVHFLQVVAHILAIAIERKQIEAALRESEERYRLIAEHTSDLIVLFDQEGRYAYASPSFRQNLGYEPADLLGTSMFDQIHPDDLSAVLKHWEQLVATGGARAAFRYQHASGSWRWFEASGAVVPQRGATYFVGIAHDITERRLAEEQLRFQKTLLECQSEAAPDGILIVSADGEWLSFNRRFVAMWGLSDEIVACRSSEVAWTWIQTRLVDPKTYRDQVTYLEQHPDETSQNEVALADGRIFDCYSAPIRNVEGVSYGRIWYIRDITTRKELEARLLHIQKLESVGQLAGGVAHDFNNLLMGIMGYTDLALFQLPEHMPARGDLEEVQRIARRGADLTRQLLAFARKQKIEPKLLNLNDLIAGVVKLLHRLIGEDITLVTLPAPDLGMVKADPGQIEQVLVNLAVNARDAMPHGGTLAIATANVAFGPDITHHPFQISPGAYVSVVVSDTGAGMSEEVRQHLFEPFFTTKGPGHGTGLGLATCYGIMTQHGGTIDVDTAVGQGARFTLYLPRAGDPRELWSTVSEDANLPVGSETVLVVEDEEPVRAVITHVLRQQGYHVLEAPNSDRAMALAQSALPALLLTDVVLPDLSGALLAERLRALHPRLKVIFMSGYTGDALPQDEQDAPGAAFLQKPFSLLGLVQKVRQVLDAQTILPDSEEL